MPESSKRERREEAQRFIERAGFWWYQRFELAPGVETPGERDVAEVLSAAGLPKDLTGLRILDIGTTNGGMAFEAERRGAERVVAVDIYPPHLFGFDAIRDLIGSHVEFVEGTVYELPALFDEPFDVVLFLGVLYHLRHPLLALDSLRRITRGWVALETAVADEGLANLGELAITQPLARFFRRSELNEDPSNWFAPTVVALLDWCHSAGFVPRVLGAWPSPHPSRCMMRLDPTEGAPEFSVISYETHLEVRPTTQVH